MNQQRKKGVLDICVLAVLRRGPSYGYQIVKDVSACIDISESTLYPILRRLESTACLSTYQEDYNGRTRKYYRIEAPGLEKLRDFLSEADEMKRIYAFIEEANK